LASTGSTASTPARISSLAEVRERLMNEGGMQPVSGSAAEFAVLIAGEKDRWGKLVKETGARVD
jgi:tripartite-type tricarboxylate transporter receptor subunit TctC